MISDYEKNCLIYALKTGLFELVKQHQPIDLNDLISKTKMGKRGGEAVIDLLTALGNH